MEALRSLPIEERISRIKTFTQQEAEAILFDWECWARPNQHIPPGDWRYWLVRAGRGYGKTRTGSETVRIWARTFPFVNLIAPTADDARDIMIEGESGILAICPSSERPMYWKSRRQLEWPSGAKSLVFTADEPDRLRGKQHFKLWCFIAGTRIVTPHGDRAIESLCVGRKVLTRRGYKRIAAISSGVQIVGRVRFSNGAELIGTKQHPVLSSCGWTMLNDLGRGQLVLTGKERQTDISRRTLGDVRFISTVGFGNKRMVQFPQGSTSITSTASGRTMRLKTSNAAREKATSTNMLHGQPFSRCPVQSAASYYSESGETPNLSAFGARKEKGMITGAVRAIANSVAKGSSRFVDSSVVSVASTWEAVGKRRVYNLAVEGCHEYIANGIIVHNCDEIATWRYAESWDQAMFGLRLGTNPQAVVTTTPRPIKIIRDLVADPHTIETRGTTYENKENLAPAFLAQIITKYEGTRLGRQELNAELLEDNPNALWKRDNIDSHRATLAGLPTCQRVVVAIDPAVSSHEDSDETGIVVCGRDHRWPPHFYVLADESNIYTPKEWGEKAVAAYKNHKADRIIGESNNGGDLVEANIRGIDVNVPYRCVHATRGKEKRAEPIAGLYEQGRVHHVGFFAKLEDQMVNFNPQDENAPSPDRMDALVWGLSELSDNMVGLTLSELQIKQNEELMQKVQASTLMKPVTVEEGEKCEACGSPCIVQRGPTRHCNSCGHENSAIAVIQPAGGRAMLK